MQRRALNKMRQRLANQQQNNTGSRRAGVLGTAGKQRMSKNPHSASKPLESTAIEWRRVECNPNTLRRSELMDFQSLDTRGVAVGQEGHHLRVGGGEEEPLPLGSEGQAESDESQYVLAPSQPPSAEVLARNARDLSPENSLGTNQQKSLGDEALSAVRTLEREQESERALMEQALPSHKQVQRVDPRTGEMRQVTKSIPTNHTVTYRGANGKSIHVPLLPVGILKARAGSLVPSATEEVHLDLQYNLLMKVEQPVPWRCTRCFHVFHAIPKVVLHDPEGAYQDKEAMGRMWSRLRPDKQQQRVDREKYDRFSRGPAKQAIRDMMSDGMATRNGKATVVSGCPSCGARGQGNMQWLANYAHYRTHGK